MSLKEQLLAISAMARATQAMAEGIIAALEPPAPAEPGAGPEGCPHPEDRRIRIGAMGNPGAWVCEVCQHQGGETCQPS